MASVAVVVGSLRKGSFSRKLARAMVAGAPAQLALEIVEIRDLPLYNQDDDTDPRPRSKAFKHKIADVEAVHFVTPEYNRSVPGVLKNDRRRVAFATGDVVPHRRAASRSHSSDFASLPATE